MSLAVVPSPPGKHAHLFQQLDYLVKAALWLITESLNTRHKLETVMATVEELQAALDANTASVAVLATAITTEIAQLAAAIAALTPGDPVTQAQIDQLNASTAALQTATASLTADDPATP